MSPNVADLCARAHVKFNPVDSQQNNYPPNTSPQSTIYTIAKHIKDLFMILVSTLVYQMHSVVQF